jgi:hypothetical protein
LSCFACSQLGPCTHADYVRSAFKGKQAVIAHPKEVAAAQEGLFTKIAHANEVYDDASGTAKEYPQDKRKLGFYTKAPARGMGAKTIDMERYRSHVHHEFKHIDAKLASAHEDLVSSGELKKEFSASASLVHTKFEKEGSDVKEGMPTTLYDYVHSDMTRPDWQKTSRDVWYHPKLRPSDERKVRNAQSASIMPNLLGNPAVFDAACRCISSVV